MKESINWTYGLNWEEGGGDKSPGIALNDFSSGIEDVFGLEGSAFSKDAWLQTGDNSGHAWWEHKATPGHHAIRSAIPNLVTFFWLVEGSDPCGQGARLVFPPPPDQERSRCRLAMPHVLDGICAEGALLGSRYLRFDFNKARALTGA
eukprot:750072-Hanusia_phi.AAC.3